MNTIQAIPTQIVSRESFIPESLFAGPSIRTDYLWKNLVVEKRISMNWAHKLFKGSIFHSFWTVWSSPVN